MEYSSLEKWDPMKEAFQRTEFNSYDHGPGKYMPRTATGESVQLYVTGIPNELSEEGLWNMFSQCGEVELVKKMPGKEGYVGTFGFIHFKTIQGATEGIRRWNGKTFMDGRYKLRVQFARGKQEHSDRDSQEKMRLHIGSGDEDYIEEDHRIVVNRDQPARGVAEAVKPQPNFPAGRGFFTSSQNTPDHRRPENGHSSGYESTNSGDPYHQDSHSQFQNHHHRNDQYEQQPLQQTWQQQQEFASGSSGNMSTRGHGGATGGSHPHLGGMRGGGRGEYPSDRGGFTGSSRGGFLTNGRGSMGRGFTPPPVRGGFGGGGSADKIYRGGASGGMNFNRRGSGRHPVPGYPDRFMQSHNAPAQDLDETSSIASSMMDKTCYFCGNPARNKCKRCKVAYYCGQDCQRKDWATHRVHCNGTYHGECKFWMIFGFCSKLGICGKNHSPSTRETLTHLRTDAVSVGLIGPVNGRECLFWRLNGECTQAHVCVYEHLKSSQAADVECPNWRMGHCIHGDRCVYLHFTQNLGVDQVIPSSGRVECTFWRTSGCRNGAECRFLHLEESRGIDYHNWQEQKAQKAQLMQKLQEDMIQSGLPSGNPITNDPLTQMPARQRMVINQEGDEIQMPELEQIDTDDGLLSPDRLDEFSSPSTDVKNLTIQIKDLLNMNNHNGRRVVEGELSPDNGPPELEADSELETEQGKAGLKAERQLETKSAFEKKFEVSCDPEAFVKEAVQNPGATTEQPKPKTQPDVRPKVAPAATAPPSKDAHCGQATKKTTKAPQHDRGSNNKPEEKWVSSKDKPSKVKTGGGEKSRGNKSSGMSSSDTDREVGKSAANRKPPTPQSFGSGDQAATSARANVGQSVAPKDGGGDAVVNVDRSGQQKKQEGGDQSTFRGRIKFSDVAQESLPAGKATKVVVTHFEHPGKFYLSKLESFASSIELLGDLAEAYSTSKCLGYTPEKKELVAARFKEDGGWYRARVDAIDLNGSLRVTFVDYGNTDEVAVSEVRKLGPQFVKLPIQGMLCKLHVSAIGSQWSTEPIELCATELMPPMVEKELQATLVKASEDHQVVDLVDPSLDINVAQVLISKGLAKSAVGSEHHLRPGKDASAASPTNTQSTGGSPPAGSRQQPMEAEMSTSSAILVPPIAPLPLPNAAKRLHPGEMVTLKVLEVVSPSQLYIHILSPDLDELEPLSEALDQHYGQLPPRKDTKVTGDKLYACKFTADNRWYRALAYDLSPAQITVQYLDYGNYEAVPHTHLRPLEGAFRTLQLQAVCCSLIAIESVDGGVWSPEACQYLMTLVGDQVLNGLIVAKDDSQVYLEIVNQKKESIDALMIEKGYAREKAANQGGKRGCGVTQKEAGPSQTTITTYPKLADLPKLDLGDAKELIVQVTHAPSPTDFVVQVVDPDHPVSAQLLEVMHCLATTQGEPYRPLGVGELVCARYQEDQDLYRAEVLELSQTTAKVRFIDYGNVEDADTASTYKISPDLMGCPCLGIRCGLAGIQGLATGVNWDSKLLQPSDKLWRLKIDSGDTNTHLLVDLCDPTDGDESLTKTLVYRGLLKPSVNTRSAAVLREVSHSRNPQHQIARNSFKEEVSTVCMFYYVGPHEMYVSCVDDPDLVTKYIEMQILLNTTYEHDSEVYSPKKDELVVVYSQEYKEWYRAQVVSMNNDMVSVSCIDFGNSLDCPLHLVRKIKPEFTELPMQVIRCSLFGLDETTLRWSGTSIQRLDSLTKGGSLRVRVDGVKGHTTIISEISDSVTGKDLVETLLEEGCLKAENVGRLKKKEKDSSLGSTGKNQYTENTTGEEFVVSSSEVPLQKLPERGCSVTVVHADSMDQFFVNLCVDRLPEKLEQLEKDIKGCVSTLPYQPMKGELVLAFWESSWYRAEVTDVRVEMKMTKVFFVDYGNQAKINFSELRKMRREFMSLPRQAIKCCLSGIQGNAGSGPGGWSEEARNFFQNNILEKTLDLCHSGIVEEGGHHAVDFMSPKKKLLTEVLVEKSLAVAKPAAMAAGGQGGAVAKKPAPKVAKHQSARSCSSSPSQTATNAAKSSVTNRSSHRGKSPPPAQRVVSSPKVKRFQSKTLDVVTLTAGTWLVTASDVVTPRDFTLMKLDEMVELNEISEKLTHHCSNTAADPGLSLNPGDLCCALYTADGQWYRAEVIEVLSPAQLKVRFIDYGNVEVQDLANLRPFKEDFLTLKAQAICCSLQGFPAVPVDIPPHVSQEFSALVKDKQIQCVMSDRRGGVSHVNLRKDGTDEQTDINKTIVHLLQESMSSPSGLSVMEKNESLRRELDELKAQMEELMKRK